MKDEMKDFWLILALVVVIILAYIVSGIFLRPEPKKIGDELRPPVNRLEKIREGFVDK